MPWVTVMDLQELWHIPWGNITPQPECCSLRKCVHTVPSYIFFIRVYCFFFRGLQKTLAFIVNTYMKGKGRYISFRFCFPLRILTWETVEAFQVCDWLSCWPDRKCLQWIWRHLCHPDRRRGGATGNASQHWRTTDRLVTKRPDGLRSSQGQTWTGATYSERVCDAGSCHFGGWEGGLLQQTVTGFWMTHRAVGLALNEKGTFSIVIDMAIITVRTVQCFSEEVAWVGGLPDMSTVLDMWIPYALFFPHSAPHPLFTLENVQPR